MPIVDLQRQFTEKGRIRLGNQVVAANGKRRPAKLETFRFSSADRKIIDAIARLYGGTAGPSDTLTDQWEVISERDDIPVLVPPSDMAFSQWYESWGKGFCTARCDGRWDSVNDRACSCNPEERDCKMHTRLSVMLPEVPGIGLFRVESQGYYSGVELLGAMDLVRRFGGGELSAARLRIRQEQRRSIRDGKPETRNFPVVELALDVTVAALGAGGSGPLQIETGGAAPSSLGAPSASTADAPPVSLYPGRVQPDALPEAPTVTVAEQMAAVNAPPKPKRKGSVAIPATGVVPRKAADVDNPVCTICGNAYGTEPLQRNKGAGSRFVHKKCALNMETPAGIEPITEAEPIEGDADQQDPASQGPEDDRGGTSSGGALLTAEPPPAVAPTRFTAEPKAASTSKIDQRPMTHGMHRKLFAVTAEAFPVLVGETAEQADQRRKDAVLDLAGVVGQPGIGSRTEINHATASALIDVLGAIADGTLAWTDGDLVRTDTGELVKFEEATP